MSEEEKEGLAKIAYFFRHTMGRVNVAQSALSGEDIANWNGAALAADRMCRDHNVIVCEDQH
jgi:hypothetical protein